MKTTSCIFMLLFMSIVAWAQDTDFSNRDILLKILDKKGRPVNKVLVQSVIAGQTGVTDRSGQFVFRDISDNDTLSLKLPKYGQTLIPVAGMDSLVVTLRSKKLYSYMANDEQSIVIEKETLEPGSLLNVPELLRQRPCNTLAELLQGQVAGLRISTDSSLNGTTTANIRGPSSINSSNEPLVVLDGTPIGTLNEASRRVDVYTIKSIEVLKNATEWGIMGGNGVILVKTK